MKNIHRRIEKIEKELDTENKTQWLHIPDKDSETGFIEIKGCLNLADFLCDIDRLNIKRK
jgi:hypothetical protein